MEQRKFPFIYSEKVKKNMLRLIWHWWCKDCAASPEGCHGCDKNIDDAYQQPTHFKKKGDSQNGRRPQKRNSGLSGTMES